MHRSSRATTVAAASAVAVAAAVLVVSCSTQRSPYAVYTQRPAVEVEPELGTESYERRYDNPFLTAADNPLSTFSVDVDTASYANVRRFLRDGQLPPPDAVRIEELVNYFRYERAQPTGEHPLAITAEVGPCPWQPAHRLVRLGLTARSLPARALPPRRLTFLVDTSGSMFDGRKLPLLKRALALLVETLGPDDRVALVTYAGRTAVALPPTSGAEKGRILAALDVLEAGGGTNGSAGIELAYQAAAESFAKDGVNRVVLATDGDFNLGVSSPGDSVRLIEQKRESGISLTVLGFGMGNLKDSTLESLADKGNGNYAYIDTLAEARKVLVEEAAGTLVTMAKDVKVQVELNPAQVASYRLVGYENRLLRREEFNDDRADAGEMGAGQTVTALYEIVPARGAQTRPISLRYQGTASLTSAANGGELLAVKVRYKAPASVESRLFATEVRDDQRALAATSADFRFAAAVASFGMALRDSPDKGEASFALAAQLAAAAGAERGDEHRREFVGLVDKAGLLGEKSRSRRP